MPDHKTQGNFPQQIPESSTEEGNHDHSACGEGSIGTPFGGLLSVSFWKRFGNSIHGKNPLMQSWQTHKLLFS